MTAAQAIDLRWFSSFHLPALPSFTPLAKSVEGRIDTDVYHGCPLVLDKNGRPTTALSTRGPCRK